MIFDGEAVSLTPSVGSHNLGCQSHYFITEGMIRWVPSWEQENAPIQEMSEPVRIGELVQKQDSWWTKFKGWLFR